MIKSKKYGFHTKHIWILFWVFLCLMFFLGGCQSTGEKGVLIPGTKSYKIYYLENEEKEIKSEQYVPTSKDSDREGLLTEFLERLASTPTDLNSKKTISDNIHLVSHQILDDKLSLYFDDSYAELQGISEVLVRAAIVKTLCQIDGIDAVEFYVDRQPLMENADRAVGFMNADSFIDNTGDETHFFQYADLTLYFTDKTGTKLVPVDVSVRYDGTIPLVQLIAEQLIKGPKSIKGVDKTAVFATIPEKTVLNKISVKDGTCFIDLNQEFLNKSEDITDEVAIYSVVNSLSELSSIDKVEFLIDGQQQMTYREKLVFDEDFERNLDLVEE